MFYSIKSAHITMTVRKKNMKSDKKEYEKHFANSTEIYTFAHYFQ
jgi:uncharacterized membrane-anchored protein YhcB (DUF1043 family)